MIRVLIVDDNARERDGLKYSIIDESDIEIVGEASDGAEAVQMARQLKPDVVLMDLRMPTMSGREATEQMVTMQPPPYVVAMSTYQTEPEVRPAMQAGASATVKKDAPLDVLLRAIRQAAPGGAASVPSIMRGRRAPSNDSQTSAPVRSTFDGPRPGSDILSEFELDVLKYVGAGWTNAQVATKLACEETEVRDALYRIYNEFGVKDRSGAVGEGHRRGILGV